MMMMMMMMMIMMMMRGVLKCGCVCDDCEETRGPASSGSCAQGPSHSFQWRRSGGSSLDLPWGEWTWTWTGGMSEDKTRQVKTKQVLAFSLTIASNFSLSLSTSLCLCSTIWPILYGLITDRVVRYCCQNYWFRNKQPRPLTILSRKLLPAHWLENRDDWFFAWIQR